MITLATYGTDAPAFNAWAADLALYGGEGRIPAGEYVLDEKIVATFDKPTRIVGDGDYLTDIRWTNEDGGFDWTIAGQHRFTQEGMSLRNTGLAQGTGLKITYPYCGSSTDRGAVLNDLSFKGHDCAEHCWAKALHLKRCWNSSIERLHVKGQDDATAPFAQTSAIELEECMAAFLRDMNIYHVGTGLLTSGNERGEGVDCWAFEFVGVNKGIVLNGQAAAGTSIGDGHINAYERGIVVGNHRMMSIQDMLIFKCHLSQGYWQGVELLNCEGITVHDNTFRGNPLALGGNDCITLGATYNCRIHDNDGGDFGAPGSICVLHAGSAGNRVYDHTRGTNCTPTALIGAGANNLIRDS